MLRFHTVVASSVALSAVLVRGAAGAQPPAAQPPAAQRPADSLAYAPDTAPRPDSAKHTPHVVVYDLRTGALSRVVGGARYRRGDRVRVLFVNVNPFRYGYTFSTTTRGVAAADAGLAADLLKTLGLAIGASSDATTDGKAGSAAAPAGTSLLINKSLSASGAKNAPPGGCAACRTENAAADAVGAWYDVAHTVRDGQAYLAATLATFETAARADSTTLAAPAATGRQLYYTSRALADRAAALLRDTQARAGADAADTTAVATLRAAAQRAFADAGAHPTEGKSTAACRDELARAQIGSAAAAAEGDAALAAARALGALRVRVATVAGNVRAIVGDNAHPAPAFWRELAAGPYDSATVVLVGASRLDLTAAPPKDPVTLTPDTLTFGSARALALAVGPAAAFGILRNTYVRENSVDPSDSTKTRTIVGVSRRENLHVPVLALLHLRVWDDFARGNTLYLTVGTEIATDVFAGVRGWVVGPSLGLRDDRLFLTLGALAGPDRTISGGLRVGQPVPDGVAEIPTRTSTRIGAAFAASYRVNAPF